MFINGIKINFLSGTEFEVTFIDGKVFKYDISELFDKYPQLRELENRELFISGKLDVGGYGVIWNDDLDLSIETVYENGTFVRTERVNANQQIGYQIAKLRQKRGVTQSELSKMTGIDQGDISKLERGVGNPSLKKIDKILDALCASIKISFEK